MAIRDWASFADQWRWRQGEHVTIIGYTGSGKSVLARRILPVRDWVVVLATKARDRELDRLEREDGWTRIGDWPPRDAHARRIVLWPKLRRPADQDRQRDVFARCLDDVFAEGGWTVAVDEASYVANDLGLADRLDLLWQQGRALGVSQLASTQRPRGISLHAYAQASHLFLFRSTDRYDRKRLAEIGGGADLGTIRSVVANLPDHACLYVGTRSGRLTITRTPAP